MTTIYLETKIKAPISTVFDLSRSIDIHMRSTSQTHEKAIAGRTTGLIKLHETVTWKGKHFGFWLKHTSIITAFEKPIFFVDEMKKGHFKSLKHEHIFKENKNHTLMIDKFNYETPYGIFGRIFNYFILKKHLQLFLEKRNLVIKKTAESL